MPEIIVKKGPPQVIALTKPGEYEITLAEAGAEAVVTGKFEAAGSEKCLVSVVLRHTAPHTKATTNLRGVARDTAHLTFIGRIIIEPNCGDTNSFLTERILLLSDTARAEAIPDLEIKTDDVKCSHAASISHIPLDQLFYLMSRCISKVAAEAMIVEGFLAMI